MATNNECKERTHYTYRWGGGSGSGVVVVVIVAVATDRSEVEFEEGCFNMLFMIVNHSRKESESEGKE